MRFFSKSAGTLVLLLGMLHPGLAQTMGQIEGRVLDPQHRAVPGAEVTLVESGTGQKRQLIAGGDGWFTAPSLPPGVYEVEARYSGFRPESRRGVRLDAGRTIRLEFQLELGKQQESVVVSAEAQPLSLSPGDWGRALDAAKLDSLPLNGRDLFDLATQLPGAHLATTSTRTVTTGRGARVSVNGSRPNQNSFRMDGIYINDATGSSPASATGTLLGLEAVRELQLITTPFDAEYGRAVGAALTAVSKSGSNAWHGSAFEYLRNSALDARNYFDPPQEPIPPLRKNQFGALLSGPVRANRLFFLASYEGYRQVQTQTARSVVPNQAARLGSLPSRNVTISPTVRPYLDLYPLPNGKDYGDGTGEYISAVKSISGENYYTGKLDWVASSRWRYAGRYTFDNGRLSWPDPLLLFTFEDTSRYHFLHNQAEYVPSQNTVHSLRAGFSRVWNRQDSSQSERIRPELSFVPGMPMGNITFTAGMSYIGGERGASLAQLPRRYVLNNYQLSYAATLIRGSHMLRAGGSFDRIQFNQLADYSAKGTYNFSSLLEFLQGQARSGRLQMPGSDTIRGWRQNVYSAYLQDQWRVRSRFGVSLGVRYETYTTPTEVHGKIATFPGDFYASQSVTVGGPLFRNPARWNFAPRASLAYAPFGGSRLVVRAGAGIFFDLIGSRELAVAGARVPPFYQSLNLNRPAFPNLLQAAQTVPQEKNIDMLDYHLLQPYVAQYQFQVQMMLPSEMVLQIGYAGSRGVHLLGFVGEINPNRPEILPDGQLFFPATLNRLNPYFGVVSSRRSQFDSNYHALQALWTRSWRRGFGYQMKYTFGKAIDTVSNVIRNDYSNFNNVPTMFNHRLNRGPSDFDVTHALAANFTWALPSPRSSPAAWFIRGWELHGMLQVQTGPPFSPSVGFDRARLSGGGPSDLQQRPVFAPSPGQKVILESPARWFDPLAFALPPAGMYGNLGRNALRGPGLAVLDLAAHKILWRREGQNLRLRAEAFNLTNHPNFQIPSGLTIFDSSLNRVGSAGQITATTTTSRQIQLALRYEF